MSYDLVIRGGTVVDGTGMPSYRADLGISSGRIAHIGRITERGKREVDAEGHLVTPGFIDGHTHMDAQIHWDPLGTSSSWNGVTSVVMGNCGFTLAPSAAERAPLVIRSLERSEDISPTAMKAGIKWSWETFPEYMQTLHALPKGINYATYVGHSALRAWAMGEQAFERAASPEELTRMVCQVRAAMCAGAVGLSTSRSSQHETSDDRPVASRLASWQEVRALVGAIGEMGGGLFEIAKEEAGNSADPVAREEYHGRLLELAVDTGVTLTSGVQPIQKVREAMQDQLKLLDRVSERGGRAFGQAHSRGVSILTSFLTYLPFDRLPEWKEIRKLPLAEQKRLLADPKVRQGLVHAAQHGNYGRAIGAEAKKPNYDLMRPYLDTVNPAPTIAETAKQRGVDPVEALIDMALEHDLKLFFVQPTGPTDDDTTLSILRHPRCVLTFSDAGAHVTQISDCSIQAHLLAYWTRERHAFTIEEAVRMITLAPARAFGFHDRGLLRPGLAADLNVIDFAAFRPEVPELVQDLPAEGKRLVQRCSGIKATVVGGEVLFQDGRHTGALPGKVLLGPAAQA
jgi:N-acyl-D-aspartate/D-glutamate deacylase